MHWNMSYLGCTGHTHTLAHMHMYTYRERERVQRMRISLRMLSATYPRG